MDSIMQTILSLITLIVFGAFMIWAFIANERMNDEMSDEKERRKANIWHDAANKRK